MLRFLVKYFFELIDDIWGSGGEERQRRTEPRTPEEEERLERKVDEWLGRS